METSVPEARRRLISLLQGAYSGELAAAHAYRGHWKSVGEPQVRDKIRQIEEEEHHHRAQVGEMLQELGAGPSRLREAIIPWTGRILSPLCYVTGWLLPMIGAGLLECMNIAEYEDAARHAHTCGAGHLSEALLTMAEVEHDHEAYFFSQVERHWFGKRFVGWPRPGPREQIRKSFREFLSQAEGKLPPHTAQV